MLFLDGNSRYPTLLQVQKSDNHVGHLHAGVVDIVLHVHLLPGGAQQANECIAKNRIAQVADVRCFVGIDAGVLNERMNARGSLRPGFGACQLAHAGCAVEPCVDVTSSGYIKR